MKEESTRGLYKETLPKIEEDQEDEETPLYVTVEDKDNQRDVKEDPEEDPKRLASVAHYIMMHHTKKESMKKK
jgi:hypothetical protein